MTTKFPKSNIQISGNLFITINHTNYQEQDIKIDLKGLNQSKSGVYCLRNKLNGRLYIGMTNNLERRYKRHKKDICNDKHHAKEMEVDFHSAIMESDYIASQYLGDAFDSVFEFEVIIYCRPSELTFYEHLLITHLNPYYNIHKQKEITYTEGEKYVMDSIDLEDWGNCD